MYFLLAWAGDIPLKLPYPNLFAYSGDEEAFIFDVLGHLVDGDCRSWNLRFHWDFHEWELDIAFSFLDHTYSRVSRGEARGRIHWCLEGSGKFDTRSFYQVIRVATNCLFPWSDILTIKVPKRVVFSELVLYVSK